jgi:hypothetical protein
MAFAGKRPFFALASLRSSPCGRRPLFRIAPAAEKYKLSTNECRPRIDRGAFLEPFLAKIPKKSFFENRFFSPSAHF